MMSVVSATIDPDLDFASYYQDGRDPDRDCERLYLWHRALWGRAVPGIGPFDLEVIYHRGYGMRLGVPDGAEFWLGSDSIIPTWSAPGWTEGSPLIWSPKSQGTRTSSSGSLPRSAATSCSRATARARQGRRSTSHVVYDPRSPIAST